MAVKLSTFLNTSFAVSALDSASVVQIIGNTDVLIDSGTSGNYIEDIVNGDGITVTGGGSHAATPTVSVDSSVVATLTGTQTLTNKTINLTNNTLQMTLNQLNAALSGSNVASLTGTETLTNKTLTAPTITSPNITGPGSITDISTFGLRDATTTTYETRIQSNNTSPILTADRTLTLDVNDEDRTISLTGNLTLGGSLTTSGAHTTTLTTTANTSVTLPTSGTLISKDGSGNFSIAGTMTGEIDRSANTTVSAGTYGSGSQVPIITVDANGFIDSIGVASVAGVTGLTFDSAAGKLTISTADGSSYVENIRAETGVTANTYGDSSSIPSFTVDAYGRITAVSTKSVSIPAGYGDSEVDSHLSGGTGITYSNGAISTNDAQIVHDNLSGFVANEHIDHSTVSITAGSGLTGGGTIASSRTLNVGAGSYIAVAADTVSVDATSADSASKVVARDGDGNFSAGIITATLSGNASTASKWANARTITLGGDLTGNVSIDGSQDVTLTATVSDGTGSGLDADLLDGQHGSYYRINVYNNTGTLLN